MNEISIEEIVFDSEIKSNLSPNSRNAKLAANFTEEALEDAIDNVDAIEASIEALKCCIMLTFNIVKPTLHFDTKQIILEKLKKIKNRCHPSLCNTNSNEINKYEIID